jgi:hypothetical protein
MRRVFLPLSIFAAAMMSVLVAAPAYAQATRTWVSGVGDDANPCSRTAPCKTFAGAISKTAANGEINTIDAGAFGAVTITKSITISAEGFEAGVLATATNGIIINAGANDVVVLRGLDIDGSQGAGVTPGLNGIRFLAGSALHVQNCLIRNFNSAAPNGFGILFAPSGAAELFVSDTTISRSGTGSNGAGIEIQPATTGSAQVTLQNVKLENNVVGVRADSANNAASTINLTIVDSMVAGSSFNGIVANALAGFGAVQVMADRVTVANNAGVGLRVDGANATLRVANSDVTGNATGSNVTNGGVLRSYGNNHIDGNVADGPNPTIIPQK